MPAFPSTSSPCGPINSGRAVGNVRRAMLAALTLAALAGSSFAQNVQHLAVPQTGGIPATPVVTSLQRATNGVTLTWDGPSGYYRVFQRPSLDAKWQAFGRATNLARRVTIPTIDAGTLFRVTGPAAKFAGEKACLECHAATYKSHMNTAHAAAFTNALFISEGGQTNSSCLPCHTVGYGQRGGFISKAKTPKLAGVQCENCHGPAANHAANPDDLPSRPRVEIAATLCGGCHTDSHHPTYDEWTTSDHTRVVMDMNPTNRIDGCGRCHSESARLTLLKGKKLSSGDANVSLGCVTCHDPHQRTANPKQLRNPICSTNDYFMTASGTFKSQYQTNVNLCAQCHNHAGASWTDFIAPPHYSPQFNMFLGTVGELASGLRPNQPGSHARLIQNQCVACHMASTNYVSPEQPAITGHSFTVTSYGVCQSCHVSPNLVFEFAKMAVSYQIDEIKSALDLWATTKAPEALRMKYGALAWEYVVPGELSSGGMGPTIEEQALIPVNIQKARYNLYLVLHDGSYGAHNAPHTIDLLEAAYDWVDQEISR